jgi:hypothetical protein
MCAHLRLTGKGQIPIKGGLFAMSSAVVLREYGHAVRLKNGILTVDGQEVDVQQLSSVVVDGSACIHWSTRPCPAHAWGGLT